jgi:hypothetical protein
MTVPAFLHGTAFFSGGHMNSPQHTSRQGSGQGQGAASGQQAGAAAPGSGQQGQSSPDSSGQRQQSQSTNPPDAVPGRQYQGSGVMNKSGRFGSSQAPQDLGEGGGSDSGASRQGS